MLTKLLDVQFVWLETLDVCIKMVFSSIITNKVVNIHYQTSTRGRYFHAIGDHPYLLTMNYLSSFAELDRARYESALC